MDTGHGAVVAAAPLQERREGDGALPSLVSGESLTPKKENTIFLMHT